MWESATFNVLAGKTDMGAFLHKGAKGHGLAKGPVDSTVFYHISTSLEDTDQTFVNNEILGIGRSVAEPFANVSQSLFVDSGHAHFQGVFAFKESGPGGI